MAPHGANDTQAANTGQAHQAIAGMAMNDSGGCGAVMSCRSVRESCWSGRTGLGYWVYPVVFAESRTVGMGA